MSGRRLLSIVAVGCAIAGLFLATSAMPMVASEAPGNGFFEGDETERADAAAFGAGQEAPEKTGGDGGGDDRNGDAKGGSSEGETDESGDGGDGDDPQGGDAADDGERERESGGTDGSTTGSEPGGVGEVAAGAIVEGLSTLYPFGDAGDDGTGGEFDDAAGEGSVGGLERLGGEYGASIGGDASAGGDGADGDDAGAGANGESTDEAELESNETDSGGDGSDVGDPDGDGGDADGEWSEDGGGDDSEWNGTGDGGIGNGSEWDETGEGGDGNGSEWNGTGEGGDGAASDDDGDDGNGTGSEAGDGDDTAASGDSTSGDSSDEERMETAEDGTGDDDPRASDADPTDGGTDEGGADDPDGNGDEADGEGDEDEGDGATSSPLGFLEEFGPLASLALVVVFLAYVFATRENPIATLRSIPGRIVSLALVAVVGLANRLERAVDALRGLSSIAELPGLVLEALSNAVAAARTKARDVRASLTPFGRGDDSTPEDAAADRRVSARERIRGAFRSVVDVSGVRNVETATPSDVARRAAHAGAPEGPVRTITDSFRDVEYGDRDPDPYLEPTTDAHERLRSSLEARAEADAGANGGSGFEAANESGGDE
ncbi:DUF4129 domain-containing protein [Natrialbaceae archaeon GCM10025810]|uniref:DUF4129 domain-containing protein n=1 Tax=Halovalidus salilacus TaxID=3075124 RepID=UPI00361F520C